MKTPSRRRNPKGSPNDSVAAEFCTAIRARGDYAHVTVRAKRGLLYVYADDTEDARRAIPSPGRQHVRAELPPSLRSLGANALFPVT